MSSSEVHRAIFDAVLQIFESWIDCERATAARINGLVYDSEPNDRVARARARQADTTDLLELLLPGQAFATLRAGVRTLAPSSRTQAGATFRRLGPADQRVATANRLLVDATMLSAARTRRRRQRARRQRRRLVGSRRRRHEQRLRSRPSDLGSPLELLTSMVYEVREELKAPFGFEFDGETKTWFVHRPAQDFDFAHAQQLLGFIGNRLIEVLNTQGRVVHEAGARFSDTRHSSN